MSTQAQCPNCGGYKIDSHLSQIDPETGKYIYGSGCLLYVPLLFGGFFLIGGAILFFLSDAKKLGLTGILIGLLSSIWIIANLIKIGKEKREKEKRAYNLYAYHCNLCGYDWQWREGQPRPKVNVNPDLIAKGAQKLEEEEKQRQKQQEDAAALYYLTHKK